MNPCFNYDIYYPGSIAEDDDCVRVIGGGDYCSDVSKCRVSARGACWECVCILLMLVSVQYVLHDNQDSVY